MALNCSPDPVRHDIRFSILKHSAALRTGKLCLQAFSQWGVFVCKVDRVGNDTFYIEIFAFETKAAFCFLCKR